LISKYLLHIRYRLQSVRCSDARYLSLVVPPSQCFRYLVCFSDFLCFSRKRDLFILVKEYVMIMIQNYLIIRYLKITISKINK
jgi:hypothetical protein